MVPLNESNGSLGSQLFLLKESFSTSYYLSPLIGPFDPFEGVILDIGAYTPKVAYYWYPPLSLMSINYTDIPQKHIA